MKKNNKSVNYMDCILRQIDIAIAHGATVTDAIHAAGVPKATYYRWRRDLEHATSRFRPVHELEAEITRLKHTVSELTSANGKLREIIRSDLGHNANNTIERVSEKRPGPAIPKVDGPQGKIDSS